MDSSIPDCLVKEDIELSILIPCLNESETLAACIDKAMGFVASRGIAGEVIIADNGSTDGSQSIAPEHGARLIEVPTKGYGSAVIGGIENARGRYIIMGDADDSYDFSSLDAFVEKLREGYDLVMGNRFRGGIEPGAMSALHRYIGNPVLSGIGRIFFKSPIGDFHCGLRGFSKEAADQLNLETHGMEFASEIVVKATLQKMRIAEVPTVLSRDGRSHPPHLRSWRDGWRHLRFLLIYCPRWLFFYPGLFFIALGTATMLRLVFGPINIGRAALDINGMLYAALMILIGFQVISFAVCSKLYGVCAQVIPTNKIIQKFRRFFTLERGLVLGGLLSFIGIVGLVCTILFWGEKSFGALVPQSVMRITIPCMVLTLIGVQIIFTAFFIATLLYPRRLVKSVSKLTIERTDHEREPSVVDN